MKARSTTITTNTSSIRFLHANSVDNTSLWLCYCKLFFTSNSQHNTTFNIAAPHSTEPNTMYNNNEITTISAKALFNSKDKYINFLYILYIYELCIHHNMYKYFIQSRTNRIFRLRIFRFLYIFPFLFFQGVYSGVQRSSEHSGDAVSWSMPCHAMPGSSSAAVAVVAMRN